MRESDSANMPINPPSYKSPLTSTSNLVNHLINCKVGKKTPQVRLYDNDRVDSQYDYQKIVSGATPLKGPEAGHVLVSPISVSPRIWVNLVSDTPHEVY